MLLLKRLSLEESKVLIEGCTKKSAEMSVPQCIAVCDVAGHLIAFDRMDGGKISSISIAIDKAFTAACARNSTQVYNELCQPGKPTFGIHITNGGHFSIIGGGLPVKVDGEIVGGIGVSSGTAEQDQICADAALQYFYKHYGLKP